MAFSYISCLPKNISEQYKRDLVSSFDCDIDTIKGYLTEIANTYLLVAYRIYEINRNKTFKGKYKNIVEACQSELGFKKSTTYNMINIVEKFGKPDTSGFISYSSLFGVEKFSYSQLCEMLSLSDKQRLQVSPDMTIKEIREIKKTVSEKVIDVVDDSDDISFQTSGNGLCYDLDNNTFFDFTCSHCHCMIDFDLYFEDDSDDDGYKFSGDDYKFCPNCGYMIVSKSVFHNKE